MSEEKLKIEDDIEAFWQIAQMADESLKIGARLSIRSRKKFENQVIKGNHFLAFSRAAYWRSFVIESSRLLSKETNSDYRLPGLIEELKPGGIYGEYQISHDKIEKWNSSLESIGSAIENLHTQRTIIYGLVDARSHQIGDIISLDEAKKISETVLEIIGEMADELSMRKKLTTLKNSIEVGLEYVISTLHDEREAYEDEKLKFEGLSEENIIAYRIQNAAEAIRGRLLTVFIPIEESIDTIIRHMTFSSTQEYDQYMKLFGKKNLAMNEKKELFDHSIDKYEKKYNVDISHIKKKIRDLITRRNACAHWLVDNGAEGRKLFVEKHRVCFYKSEKEQVCFSKDTLTAFIETLESTAETIIEMSKRVEQDALNQ